MYIPFWIMYIAVILAAGWFLYEAGDLVLTLWDRHQYKKKGCESRSMVGILGTVMVLIFFIFGERRLNHGGREPEVFLTGDIHGSERRTGANSGSDEGAV